MSRRSEIRMTDAELQRFLQEERVVTCATIGRDGRPHLMPLWYLAHGTEITAWTYGTSQKVRNLERRPQATLQVEAGERYDELRGVMMECDVEIVRDLEKNTRIGVALAIRYLRVPNASEDSPEVRAHVARQAAKRVGLVFRPTRIVSWDHRKLGPA